MDDEIRRFLFEGTDIRGGIVHLDKSYREILASHSYATPVQELLGEFLAASALLAQTIKFDGQLSLQARSNGQIPLIMAECSSNYRIRGIARDCNLATSHNFAELLRDGTLCITIEPANGQRYQGIVPLDGENLPECLVHYFVQSEQLDTGVWLAANGQNAAGLLIQALPPVTVTDLETRKRQWEHFLQLATTITPGELLNLDTETLLHRLYHAENMRIFEESKLSFECSCSRERSERALASLGSSELADIIAEEEGLSINCEFCNQLYHFTLDQIRSLAENGSCQTH